MSTEQETQGAGSGDRGYVSLAGVGGQYEVLGLAMNVKAQADDTGGAFEIMEAVFPQQNGFPMHVHQDFDEALYVLDGEMQMEVEGRTVTIAPGAFGYLPRGVPHAFANRGSAPCRVLLWFAPKYAAGLSAYLDALGQVPTEPVDEAALGDVLRTFDTSPVEAS